MRRALAVVGALCVAGAPARAGSDEYLARLAATVQRRLDELAAGHTPKLVPPTPVAVRWKAVRLGSIDLGAPLVALTAGDLDGDGSGELYAVTAREVVALALRAYKPVELGRVAFAGERAVPAPRDVVGTAVVVGRELVAAASGWAQELRVTLAGTPVAQPGAAPGAGFLVCPDERWQLAPGRNYFDITALARPLGQTASRGSGGGTFHGVRCRGDLVDRAGVPLRIRAQLALGGKLGVSVERCAPGAACQPAGMDELAGAGTAFEIADVDRDGTPEVIVAGYVAPGDPDRVIVVPLGGDARKPVFKKSFNGGVVGLAVVETSPTTAPLVIAAVRLAGATRVDLWRLN